MRPLEAIAEFRRVLAVNPRNERALYAVAMLLANTGNAAEATACAERLVQVNPLHLEATYLLAILARETGGPARSWRCSRRRCTSTRTSCSGTSRWACTTSGPATPGLARRSLLNALRILDDRAAGDPVEGVEGMTVGRLRETVLAMIPGGGPGEAGW